MDPRVSGEVVAGPKLVSRLNVREAYSLYAKLYLLQYMSSRN